MFELDKSGRIERHIRLVKIRNYFDIKERFCNKNGDFKLCACVLILKHKFSFRDQSREREHGGKEQKIKLEFFFINIIIYHKILSYISIFPEIIVTYSNTKWRNEKKTIMTTTLLSCHALTNHSTLTKILQIILNVSPGLNLEAFVQKHASCFVIWSASLIFNWVRSRRSFCFCSVSQLYRWSHKIENTENLKNTHQVKCEIRRKPARGSG